MPRWTWKIWAAGGAACMLGAAGLAFRPGRPAAPGARDLLTAIPAAPGETRADRDIARSVRQARRSPGDAEAWTDLGDGLMQKARDTMDAGLYPHAERAYREALRLQPRSARGAAGMAGLHGARHEFPQSIEWAGRAIALDPGSQDAYGIRGDAALELGDYRTARADYQKMLDIRPDLASYSRGAHLLYVTGNARKGIWLMGRAVEAGGPYRENTAWCRARLGLMLWGWGAAPAAEQVLREGLRQSPKNAHLLAAMGRVQAALRRFREAIASYEQALAITPHHESAVALGDLYGLEGRRAEADQRYALVEAIHRLNRANGVRGDLQIARFWADHDRNLPEALRQARKEYRVHPNVFAADTLAWCCYKNGRLDEAESFIRRALARNTPEAGFHFHAGLIYARLGNRGAARRHLARALSLNPGFSPVDAPIAARTLRELGARPSASIPGPKRARMGG